MCARPITPRPNKTEQPGFVRIGADLVDDIKELDQTTALDPGVREG